VNQTSCDVGSDRDNGENETFPPVPTERDTNHVGRRNGQRDDSDEGSIQDTETDQDAGQVLQRSDRGLARPRRGSATLRRNGRVVAKDCTKPDVQDSSKPGTGEIATGSDRTWLDDEADAILAAAGYREPEIDWTWPPESEDEDEDVTEVEELHTFPPSPVSPYTGSDNYGSSDEFRKWLGKNCPWLVVPESMVVPNIQSWGGSPVTTNARLLSEAWWCKTCSFGPLPDSNVVCVDCHRSGYEHHLEMQRSLVGVPQCELMKPNSMSKSPGEAARELKRSAVAMVMKAAADFRSQRGVTAPTRKQLRAERWPKSQG
jgi:hypothetical protein